jgi:hypothetical protein
MLSLNTSRALLHRNVFKMPVDQEHDQSLETQLTLSFAGWRKIYLHHDVPFLPCVFLYAHCAILISAGG